MKHKFDEPNFIMELLRLINLVKILLYYEFKSVGTYIMSTNKTITSAAGCGACGRAGRVYAVHLLLLHYININNKLICESVQPEV